MRYLLIFSLLFTTVFADEDEIDDEEDALNVKEHTLTVDGKSIDYQSITGRMPMYNEDKEVSAYIFFIAYLKKDPEAARPITFMFPGGPGGSCGPETICSFGPKRLPLTSEGKPARPPYKLIDNKQTLLFETDLVFIDPVGTGYSTLEIEEDRMNFYSASGDIGSLTGFIATTLSAFEKWNSPIFLGGSSYGTTRACGVAYLLNAYHNIPVRGLILLASSIDHDTNSPSRDKYLPDCLLIPTMAATAWYHERLWPERSLEEVVDYARRFAYDDYAPAMAQPNRLNRFEKEAFYQALAEITGLPIATIQKYNGRINEEIFTSEFFGSERKILGGLDTRYKGNQSSIKRWSIEEDPSYREEIRGLLPTFTHYLQTDLEVQYSPAQYVMFASQYWYYDVVDLLFFLRRALIINPDMQIFSANGYYDCRTPFAATEYCFDQLDLPESYQNNVDFKYYEAGHGLYFDADVLKQMHGDIINFMKK